MATQANAVKIVAVFAAITVHIGNALNLNTLVVLADIFFWALGVGAASGSTLTVLADKALSAISILGAAA